MSSPPVSLEYGIYRDGDNNLDREQAVCIDQALETSLRSRKVEFVVEDTTARRGFAPAGTLRTEQYCIRDGAGSQLEIAKPHDPSDRATLAAFVARTLDRAEHNGARQTWIELVDHGGGDGGGLESASRGTMMGEADIAGAIEDGVGLHARAHPEDAERRIDGVVANMCLMATLGFADALSQAGVRYLAASPEIMLAPGVPTTVAASIANDIGEPQRMARDVETTTMDIRYATAYEAFAPAAAFSVLDIGADRIEPVRTRVRALDGDLVAAIQDDPALAAHLRADERSVPGMARAERGAMPWKADRPAIALYEKLAGDARLPANVRADARAAGEAVKGLVLAHGESAAFEPYGGRDYRDAVGPTVHAPIRERQIDPWAPELVETDNAFWKDVGADRLALALT